MILRSLSAITMLIFALAIMQPVEAQSFKPNFDAAINAWSKKDLTNTSPLAKKGHRQAQFGLGVLYKDGNGVLQDLVMAYVWLNVAV